MPLTFTLWSLNPVIVTLMSGWSRPGKRPWVRLPGPRCCDQAVDWLNWVVTMVETRSTMTVSVVTMVVTVLVAPQA